MRSVPVGLPVKRDYHLEVVDNEPGRAGGYGGARVERHLDVPGVESVLVEPQSDEPGEVECHGPHGELELGPLVVGK